MAQAAKQLNLPVQVEMQKCYPRDWLVQGRIKVMLKNKDESSAAGATFLNKNVQTKRDFLKAICRIIPTLPTRADGKGGKDPLMELVQQIAADAGPAQPKK